MIDLLLHALGGAAMAGVELALTGNVYLAIFWPTLLGYARETEQSRTGRKRREISTGRSIRPGDVRHWSLHRWGEWLVWPLGALLAACGFALR